MINSSNKLLFAKSKIYQSHTQALPTNLSGIIWVTPLWVFRKTLAHLRKLLSLRIQRFLPPTTFLQISSI
jgi:hypothetical protein